MPPPARPSRLLVVVAAPVAALFAAVGTAAAGGDASIIGSKTTTTSTSTTTTTTTVVGSTKQPRTTAPTVSNDFETGPVQGGDFRWSTTTGTTWTWQQDIAHSGVAAYRAVGGDLRVGEGSGESALMYWPSRPDPAGLGLRQVVTGWFRFESFPSQVVTRPVWIMATVPTDGITGADNKPVVAVLPSGRLVLTGSNGGGRVDTPIALTRGAWYHVELHAANGVDAVQRLIVRDAAGAVVADVSLRLSVTGTYANRITKWGFGTRQDATGTIYELDDISLANLPAS